MVHLVATKMHRVFGNVCLIKYLLAKLKVLWYNHSVFEPKDTFIIFPKKLDLLVAFL
jgi:hypothetical protein